MNVSLTAADLYMIEVALFHARWVGKTGLHAAEPGESDSDVTARAETLLEKIYEAQADTGLNQPRRPSKNPTNQKENHHVL